MDSVKLNDITLQNLSLNEKGFSNVYLGDDRRDNEAYVCLIHNTSFFDSFSDFKTPIYFIVKDKNVNLTEWGIPKEMFTHISLPIKLSETRIKRFTKKPQLYYVMPEGDTDKDYSVSRSIISTLNCLLNIEPFIIAPASAHKPLGTLANDNIHFIEYVNDFEKYLQNGEVLLASEEVAIKGLLSNIPVIVVGKHGFGGLVTDNNLLIHLTSGFKGRPGGSFYEKIPSSLLAQEIDYVLQITKKQNGEECGLLSFSNIKMLSDKYQHLDLEAQIANIIEKVRLLNASVNEDKSFLRLKPTFPSCYVINTAPNAYFLLNLYTNKILAILEDDEVSVLRYCTGNHTIEDISLNLKCNPAELIEFMRDLWKERIIVFEL